MDARSEVKSQLDAQGDRPVAPALRIEPSKGWISLKLSELWQYRELLFFLGWRDVTVRYKQTFFGAAWAIIQPLFSMIVFSLVFGKLAKMPSDGIPYPIWSFTALLPWSFFSHGLSSSSSSLVGGARLIKKVYFPRLIIPLSTTISGLVDFGVAFIVLLGMMVYYGIAPTINVIWLPFFLLLALVTSLGVGLWLSATNVQYRDVRYMVPFVTTFWMYCTPIVYPSSLLPEPWRTVYGLNPMAGVVEGFRWALLGSGGWPSPMLAISACVAVVCLLSGIAWFRRRERTFIDVIGS